MFTCVRAFMALYTRVLIPLFQCVFEAVCNAGYTRGIRTDAFSEMRDIKYSFWKRNEEPAQPSCLGKLTTAAKPHQTEARSRGRSRASDPEEMASNGFHGAELRPKNLG